MRRSHQLLCLWSVDMGTRGRTDVFDGEETKWAHWSVFMKAYGSAQPVGEMMTTAETSRGPLYVVVATAGERQQSNQLHYILAPVMKQYPLTEAANSCAGEGMAAWRKLVTVHESSVKSMVAGQLLRLLIWNLAGELEARLAPIARDVC